MRFHKLILCASLTLLSSVACSKEPPPLTAASGEQPGYAEQYPTRLNTLRTRFLEDETRLQRALPELEPASNKLGNADPATLKQLFEVADAEGRSGAYASQALESETVSRFWEEEKQPLHQKIAGAVVYAGKQKDCPCTDELGGTAAAASDRAVEKQLEERQERRGEVHRFVEDHEEALGKANADNAEKQAHGIALLSHIANVRLELYRRELEGDLKEASDVASTLERIQRESDETLADPKASKARKALAEKRKASAMSARAALDAEVEQAKRAVEDMKQRQKKAQDDYEKAFDALKDSLDARAKK